MRKRPFLLTTLAICVCWLVFPSPTLACGPSQGFVNAVGMIFGLILLLGFVLAGGLSHVPSLWGRSLAGLSIAIVIGLALICSTGIVALTGQDAWHWQCSFSNNRILMFLIHMGLPSLFGFLIAWKLFKSKTSALTPLETWIWIGWAMWSANLSTFGLYYLAHWLTDTVIRGELSPRFLHYAQITTFCLAVVFVPLRAAYIKKAGRFALAIMAPMACVVCSVLIVILLSWCFGGHAS